MAKKIINSIDRTALTPNYAPAWFTPIKGKKSILWDSNGNNYVDFGGGIAVTCLGHSHPELIKVLKAQSTKLWHVSNYLYNEPALELSELLAKKTFADKVFFSNSGNEANEAAIKLARRYFYDQGKSEKNEIIVFTDAFHGRSMLNISAGDSKMQKTGFGPLLKGFKRAKFNDLESVEKIISKKISSKNTHGSGCTFSSALAVNLAKGFTLKKSVQLSKDFTKMCILNAPKFNLSYGPVGHYL